MTDFIQLAKNRWKEGKYVCIGLDVAINKLPGHLDSLPLVDRIEKFCCEIIDESNEYVFGYKPNLAFFEGMGIEGVEALQRVTEYCKKNYPSIPLVLDGKRGDIGNTNEQYASHLFDRLHGDAVTVPPYMGENSLRPFLDRRGKCVFVLCRTSNSGAQEFQDMVCDDDPIFIHVARNVSSLWRTLGTVGLVVGATYPRELARIRSVSPEVPILIPGVGRQGGDLLATVQAADSNFIINSSREIIYSSSGEDFAKSAAFKAAQLNDKIREYLQ